MTVSPSYIHRPKQARAYTALTIGNAHLKWYDLDEPAYPITVETRRAAQLACATIPQPDDKAGFAILHRCSADFHFLLTALGRGNNEIWQSVHYIDAATPNFSAFPAAYAGLGAPRPTFCVWEMGIVAHESQAWQRFLYSDRGNMVRKIWQSDVFNGDV